MTQSIRRSRSLIATSTAVVAFTACSALAGIEDAGTFKTATIRLEGPLNRIRGTVEAAGRRPVNLSGVRITAETGRLEATFPGEPFGLEGNVLLAGSVREGAWM